MLKTRHAYPSLSKYSLEVALNLSNRGLERGGGGIVNLYRSRTSRSIYGQTFSTSPPIPLPPCNTVHQSLGGGVLHKNENNCEEGSISRKCFPRTPHHTCRPVWPLDWLNRSGRFLSKNAMVSAVTIILKSR